ncbi:CLUMA_CG007382, isoform A [Clunio marinus]|uniref:CLUMA_CG007382, isoform A n=1 Tax=Clunio marinus TaxID=568069 RepID=A0A1J1I0J4_9DIPT|nr:CLUMA_CG007382, isoform A [Clunio marinus]
MSWRIVQLTFAICWIMLISFTEAYPVESKPLNNNPETWNFGDGWLVFNSKNPLDPSAEALISSDPHIKKSKITPKSIFIAPNAFNGQGQMCPHGFRVDDNGKCIKTVTINQDEVLAARITELFGVDTNPNQNSDIDSDYYDFDDESKSDKDSGPLQINLPLAIDIEEDIDGKKVEYFIEEKVIDMRNLNPNSVVMTTEKIDETTSTLSPVIDVTDFVTTEEMITSSTSKPMTEISDETTIPFDASFTTFSTQKIDEDEVISTTMTSTETITTEELTTSTEEPTTTTSTTTTTQEPSTTTMKKVKIFSVDFLPKSQRKANRLGQINARLKNSRDRDRDRARKQKPTAISTKTNENSTTKLYKVERQPSSLRKNRTRSGGLKRKSTTTTTTSTEAPVTASTEKSFWWLPKGWSIDETKEKPVLVRFWSQQPLSQDDRARSHNARQRVNSRMPTDNIFREITAPELESVLKKK